MNMIKDEITKSLEIKKSVFITNLYRVKTLEEIKIKLKEVQIKYKDATHYCYAYIIDDQKRFSDDGEPGGTAGLPIFEVLNKKNLNYVLCVVIRYFGGIKLGSGGLVRAYSKAVSEALKDTAISNLIEGYIIEIEITYDGQKKLEHILKDKSYQKIYKNTILYQIHCEENFLEKLKGYSYKIIDNIQIEKSE